MNALDHKENEHVELVKTAVSNTHHMLEYVSVYGIDNVDTRLVRIDYNAGNRAPVTNIFCA